MTITGDIKRLFTHGDKTMATPSVTPAVPVVATAVPVVAPVAAPVVKQNWLSKIASVFGKILHGVNVVDKVIQAPLDIGLLAAGQPALANLVNLGMDVMTKIEAASTAPGTGVQKMQLAIPTLQPDIAAFEQKFGASVNVAAWTQAIYDMLNAIKVNPSA